MRYLWIILCLYCSCGQQAKSPDKEKMYQQLRQRMVKEQIESRGITDQDVLEALRLTPRHQFVPEHLEKYSYADEPLPIGEDQTISQPYIVAYMTEKLELNRNHKVLEIGTGSGYQAAILAAICDSVYTIEIVDVLARRAQKTLNTLGIDNVVVRSGDGYKGWPEHAPFDAIIVTAAPTKIPEPLVDQLKVGGRMILPVGEYAQDLVLILKEKSGYTQKRLLPVRFVPMTGEVEN